MAQKINRIGIAAGAAALVLILISMFVPWWQFTVGEGNPPPAQASFSPVNLNFSLLGTAVTIPLIWALNIVSLLTLLSGGIIMIIYSVKPNKSYSKKLLGFGWNKPLYAVIFFVVELFALAILVKNIAGFDVPLNGTATIIMPQSMTQGTNVSVAVTASIEWPFYFGIVAAGLGVAARLYHRNVVDSIPPQPK